MNKKLISIVVPVYNEQDNVEMFYDRMSKVVNQLDSYAFEFVFTDNASTDNTFKILRLLAEKDNRIRVFRFSKNFGHQRSILTGYHKAKGAAAIEYDCDLQDPPELLPEFLKLWEQGHQIVYGIRRKRGEGKMVTFFRKIFYRMINKISDDELPLDAGDYMLIDRKVLDCLKGVNDQNLYLRGVIFGCGYSRIGIEYDRAIRLRGESKFPYAKMFRLALDGIISQSTIPLKIASYFGLFAACLTLLLSLYYICLKVFFEAELPAGFTTTTVLILFSISLESIFLGIIGEYLSRIYKQTKNRPLTIIADYIDNTENTEQIKY